MQVGIEGQLELIFQFLVGLHFIFRCRVNLMISVVSPQELDEALGCACMFKHELVERILALLKACLDLAAALQLVDGGGKSDLAFKYLHMLLCLDQTAVQVIEGSADAFGRCICLYRLRERVLDALSLVERLLVLLGISSLGGQRCCSL